MIESYIGIQGINDELIFGVLNNKRELIELYYRDERDKSSRIY